MTPFAAFGICVLLTLLLILILTIITGGGFVYLVYMVSAGIIEETTRTFSRSIRQSSSVFFILVCLLICLEILIISSIFFGIFSLFYSFSDVPQAAALTPQISTAKLPMLIGLNKILLLTLVYFLGTFIFYRIQFSRKPKVEGVHAKYPSAILPSISFVLAFTYLISAYYYLTTYPEKKSIGILASIAGTLDLLYLLYSLGRTIYLHIRYRSHIFPSMKFTQAIQQVVSLAYNFTFLYFFYNTAYMLTFH